MHGYILRLLHVLFILAAVTTSGCGGKVINDGLGGATHGERMSGDTDTNDTSASSPSPAFPNVPPSSPPSPSTPSDPPSSPTDDTCSVSFKRDVLSLMTQLQCTNASCHGGTSPVNSPRIDAASPSATRAALVSFVMSDGRPYVVPSSVDPRDSGIVCNLGGACGVRMPLGGGATNAEIAIVEQWLACGAPDN